MKQVGFKCISCDSALKENWSVGFHFKFCFSGLILLPLLWWNGQISGQTTFFLWFIVKMVSAIHIKPGYLKRKHQRRISRNTRQLNGILTFLAYGSGFFCFQEWNRQNLGYRESLWASSKNSWNKPNKTSYREVGWNLSVRVKS